MVIEFVIAAASEPVHIQEMSITIPEIVLLIAGVLFTLALLTVFIVVLRKDVKRDKQTGPRRDSAGEDPSDDDSGG